MMNPSFGKRPRLMADFMRGPEGSDGNGEQFGGGRPTMLGMGGGGGGGQSGDFGNQATVSSRVLQVRGLPENTMEADLVDALSHFGPVSYVRLADRGTGWVEFEDVTAAERCVAHNRNTDILIMNTPAYFSYASVQVIPRQGLESERPSNVLIFYVQNPKYPITTDIIHAIVKPVSRVNRIIINRQSGIQALVELDTIDSARVAKQRLNGCDIYSGCCTLKIEYAKMQRLNVVKNDSDHCDYVTNTLGAANENPIGFDELGRPIFADPSSAASSGAGMDVKPLAAFGNVAAPSRPAVGLMDDYQSAAQAQMAALNATNNAGGGAGPFQQTHTHSQPAFIGGAQPPFGAIGSHSGLMMMGGGGASPFMGPSIDNTVGFDQGPLSMRHHQESLLYRHPDERAQDRASRMPDGCGVGEDNAVLMIYNVDPEKINCDKLFNLFCLYGNVMRVKFLRTKNDTAMVQMGDPVAARRAVDCLANCMVFGKDLLVSVSRQPQLNEVREPLDLPDKTSSYRDYSQNRLNRYLTADIASKNRINPPQSTLYFFNAPPGIKESRLFALAEEQKAPKPTSVKIFPQRGPGIAKNSAGLIIFENATQATEALMLCNHANIESEGSRHPFVLKLCFAGSAQSSGYQGDYQHDRGGFDGGYGGGGGGGRDRREFDDRPSRRRFDHDGDRDRSSHYNGPGGPRENRDRRGGSRDRERDRDMGGRGDSGRGRGRGRGFGRGGR